MFGAKSPPYFPYTLITISADYSQSTVRKIEYRVPLKGVEAHIKEICIVKSISTSSGMIDMHVRCEFTISFLIGSKIFYSPGSSSQGMIDLCLQY